MDIDWYKSIPTYLNQPARTSENSSEKEKFVDELFPPIKDSLITKEKLKDLENKYNSSKKKEDEEKLLLGQKLDKIKEWKRISDLFPDYDLFSPILNCNSFKQGFAIGDCYFASMVSLLSNYGDFIIRLFPIYKNPYGYYEVILFINGWKRVILDDYIPVEKDNNNNYIPITSLSQKFIQCFYHILLEKAWAKVNKMYFNIDSGESCNSLTILTGFKSKYIELDQISGNNKEETIKELQKGIRNQGYLFGVNTYDHAYSLLDVEKYDNNYVLKIRNPWGIINGSDMVEKLFDNSQNNLIDEFFQEYVDNNGKKFFLVKTRAIVGPELKKYFLNYKFPKDNGIFYISLDYFYKIFDSYAICYTIFKSTFIEYLFQFSEINVNKRYFYFKLKAKEDSIFQLNLTNYKPDNFGRLEFILNNQNFMIFINNGYDDEPINKIKKDEEYFICFKYFYNVPEDEFLFWVPYYGDIDLIFLGTFEYQKSFDDGNYIKSGFKVDRRDYKIRDKLGDIVRKKNEMMIIVLSYLRKTIKFRPEDRGYLFNYDENDYNTAMTFITNEDDPNDREIISQNLGVREYFYVGKDCYRRKIIGDGKIIVTFNGNEYQKCFSGYIFYNLFPQYPNEKNKNHSFINQVLMKRIRAANGLDEDIVSITQSFEGPFIGQKKFNCHNSHYLTNLITDRKNVSCDYCYDKLPYGSFYCSICNFDHCSHNCKRQRNKHIREKNPYADYLENTEYHEHKLIKAIIKNERHNFKCFNCLKDLSQNKKIFYCTLCDFRLCQECQINEKSGQKFQFHTCWHEHPLTLCNTEGKTGYIPNEIKKESFNNNVSKENFSKNYRQKGSKTITMTDIELPKKEEKKIYFNLKTKYKDYNKFEGNPDDYYFYFICNHCGIKYLRKNDVFYCTACDFYLCLTCQKNYYFNYSAREDKNAIKVSMNFSESYPSKCKCFLGPSKKTESYCTYCGENLILSDWNYYCSICNSIFCNSHYMEHKSIFENNVLIFDGRFKNRKKNGYGITFKKNNEIDFKGEWKDNYFKLIHDIPHFHTNIDEKKSNNSSHCDICLKYCDSQYDNYQICKECDLIICIDCKIEINSKTLKRKDHEHELSIAKYKEENECLSCNKKYIGIFFVCSECNNNEGLFGNLKAYIFGYYCCLKCFNLKTYNKYIFHDINKEN